MTMIPRRFTIAIDDDAIAALRSRLTRARIAEDHDNADWRYGVERGWLENMLGYWATAYDWRRHEAVMNRWPQFRVEIDGVPIHYLHIRGIGGAPTPIVLTHGWPWTFWDWRDVIGPLTDPASHGGDPSDAFDVIVPSLPGFGFSAPLGRTGIGVRAIGGMWRTLMHQVLGYSAFVAAGGDWGALVSAELGHAHADVVSGVHLTLPMLPGIDMRGGAATDFAADEGWMTTRMTAVREDANSHLAVHRQDPQTLAYALDDSPAGLAAWIWERRRNWSDCGGTIERAFDRDFLCTTASLYWFTRTIGSSMRLYADHRRAGWKSLHDRERVIDVPTGFAVAPAELAFLPRATAARLTNLARWEVLPAGGHFLPVEQPRLLVDEYRTFARLLR